MELQGKKVTPLVEERYNDRKFWYPYYRLKEAGTRVTVAGNLITSRPPDDLPAFLRAIIKGLAD